MRGILDLNIKLGTYFLVEFSQVISGVQLKTKVLTRAQLWAPDSEKTNESMMT